MTSVGAITFLVITLIIREPAPAAAEWEVDPQAELEPSTVTIPILVREVRCASGRAADGRIEVSVAYRTDEVELEVGVRPRRNDQDCQGNPISRYTVELDEPLGDRSIVGQRPLRD